MKNTAIIIPARLEAKRFRNKPLVKINGIPMIIHVLNRAKESRVGNVFVDPVYQITHNTEIDNGVIGNSSYSEHNYYYYRGTGAVDFRAKNIESWDSLEENSIDLYASFKSLYLLN